MTSLAAGSDVTSEHIAAVELSCGGGEAMVWGRRGSQFGECTMHARHIVHIAASAHGIMGAVPLGKIGAVGRGGGVDQVHRLKGGRRLKKFDSISKKLMNGYRC